jgi:carboxypeptidase C (cathepsin A)
LCVQGLAIGNGLTNPAIQYGAYSDYALLNGLIGQGLAEKLKLVRTPRSACPPAPVIAATLHL